MSVPMAEHFPDQESQKLLLEDGVLESCEHVAGMLITGSKFFTLGMRAFYFSIPFVFYYFGPLALLLSTLATLAFIYAGESSLGAQKLLQNRKSRSGLQREDDVELDHIREASGSKGQRRLVTSNDPLIGSSSDVVLEMAPRLPGA